MGVDTVHAGDDLPAASDAVAEVEHFDGSLTRLDAGAVAQLGRLADPDGRPHVVITLGPGDSWHRTSGESSRHGQYEANSPSAVAMARSAVFVVRSRDDGSAWFATLDGTVVVRGHAGGTVVLHPGEAVTSSPSGALGDVERLGVHRLHEDDWIAVNIALDVSPQQHVQDEEPEVAPAPGPAPLPALGTTPSPGPSEETLAERDHPWRIGVAAVLAIGLGIFSVVIGRSAGTDNSPDPEPSPGVAMPAPPSFSGPAVTAPSAPAPPTTAAPAPPKYDVDGRTCTRRSGSVHYRGTVRNDDPVTRDYTIEVRFLDRAGRAIATSSTAVDAVPAGATRSFHATGAGSAIRVATDCEVGAVTAR